MSESIQRAWETYHRNLRECHLAPNKSIAKTFRSRANSALARLRTLGAVVGDKVLIPPREIATHVTPPAGEPE